MSSLKLDASAACVNGTFIGMATLISADVAALKSRMPSRYLLRFVPAQSMSCTSVCGVANVFVRSMCGWNGEGVAAVARACRDDGRGIGFAA